MFPEKHFGNSDGKKGIILLRGEDAEGKLLSQAGNEVFFADEPQGDKNFPQSLGYGFKVGEGPLKLVRLQFSTADQKFADFFFFAGKYGHRPSFRVSDAGL